MKNKNSSQQIIQEEVKANNKVRVYKNSGKYGEYYTAKKGEVKINFSLKQIQIADEYFEKNKNKGRQEILNYFKTKLTNARTEGYNRVAKGEQYSAFGVRNFINYRLRMLNI